MFLQLYNIKKPGKALACSVISLASLTKRLTSTESAVVVKVSKGLHMRSATAAADGAQAAAVNAVPQHQEGMNRTVGGPGAEMTLTDIAKTQATLNRSPAVSSVAQSELLDMEDGDEFAFDNFSHAGSSFDHGNEFQVRLSFHLVL